MSKVKVGDRVKWTSQSSGVWREKVGVVRGIVPADGCMHTLVSLCGPLTGHKLLFDHGWGRGNSYVWSRGQVSYLVSVKTGKTNRAKRTLYRPRRVELCEPDDERDGVYPVEKGEEK